MWPLFAAQGITPGDAQAWTDTVERGGVIGVLVLVIVIVSIAVGRRWLVPGYVVTILERRIVQLEEREEKLLDLALKGATVSQTAVTALKQRG
jgi:hypothetical protein